MSTIAFSAQTELQTKRQEEQIPSSNIHELDDARYESYLKTKKLLREFNPLKGIYMSAKELYYKSLSCSNKEDFRLYYERISTSSNPYYMCKFAEYFADELSLKDMRRIYKTLVDIGNEIEIARFIKNVLPKIQDKEEERYF